MKFKKLHKNYLCLKKILHKIKKNVLNSFNKNNIFQTQKKCVSIVEDIEILKSFVYLAKEHVVRLILNGHQHDQNPIEKLKTFQ